MFISLVFAIILASTYASPLVVYSPSGYPYAVSAPYRTGYYPYHVPYYAPVPYHYPVKTVVLPQNDAVEGDSQLDTPVPLQPHQVAGTLPVRNEITGSIPQPVPVSIPQPVPVSIPHPEHLPEPSRAAVVPGHLPIKSDLVTPIPTSI